MKNALKLSMGLALVLLVQITNGQGRPERPSPEEMLEKFTKELSLTEEQVTQWEAIHEEYGDDMKSDPRATMPKGEEEIKAILTEEQWEKFEEMKPRRKKRRNG